MSNGFFIENFSIENPWEEKAHIYRQGRDVEIIEDFSGKILTGEEVLPNFELPLEAFRQRK